MARLIFTDAKFAQFVQQGTLIIKNVDLDGIVKMCNDRNIFVSLAVVRDYEIMVLREKGWIEIDSKDQGHLKLFRQPLKPQNSKSH